MKDFYFGKLFEVGKFLNNCKSAVCEIIWKTLMNLGVKIISQNAKNGK